MPRAFIAYKYVGGADDVERLNDTGELRALCEGIEVVRDFLTVKPWRVVVYHCVCMCVCEGIEVVRDFLTVKHRKVVVCHSVYMRV